MIFSTGLRKFYKRFRQHPLRFCIEYGILWLAKSRKEVAMRKDNVVYFDYHYGDIDELIFRDEDIYISEK